MLPIFSLPPGNVDSKVLGWTASSTVLSQVILRRTGFSPVSWGSQCGGYDAVVILLWG